MRQLIVRAETSFSEGPGGDKLLPHVPYIVPDVLADEMRRRGPYVVESDCELPDEIKAKFYRHGQSKPKTMLWIRRGGFGDLLMLTPLMRIVKTAHPDCQIDMAAGPGYGYILRRNPLIRQILPTSYIPVHDAMRYDAIAWFDGTIERDERRVLSGVEVFGVQLRIGPELLSDQTPNYYPDPEIMKDIAGVLAKYEQPMPRHRVVLQVFGSAPQRAWPLRSVVDLLAVMTAVPGLQTYVVGQLPPDYPGARELFKSLDLLPQTINLVNHTANMDTVAALIAQCDLFIGPDSSGIHLAAAMGKRCIGLYGPFPSWARGGRYPTCIPLEYGTGPGECKLDCQPCFQHSANPCLRALTNKSNHNVAYAECMEAIHPARVMHTIASTLGFPGLDKDLHYQNRFLRIKAALERSWYLDVELEASEAITKQLDVAVIVINGGAPSDVMIKQLEDMKAKQPAMAFKKLEFFVMVNGQPPEPLAKLATVIYSPENHFPPIPYNTALVTIEGKAYDWIVMLDDDLAEFKPNWLAILLSEATKRGLDCWAPEFCHFSMGQEHFATLGYQHGFATALFGFNRRVHEALGYFDEQHYEWHGFDSDFIARVQLAGLTAGLLPATDGLVKHKGHQASARRGFEHTYVAMRSTSAHHRRWRGIRTPYVVKVERCRLRSRMFLNTPGWIQVAVGNHKQPARCEHITAIIPTIGASLESLERCVKAVMSQVGEVLVIASGMKESIVAELQQRFVSIIANQTLRLHISPAIMGFTDAANVGIQNAKPENDILLLNDDMVVDSWCVFEMQAEMNQTTHIPLWGIISALHLDSVSGQDGAIHVGTCPNFRMRDAAQTGTVEMDWCGFCCTLIKREVIEKVGLLDAERFPLYSSDKDYCHRAHEAGYLTIAALRAEAIHEGGNSTRLLSKQNPVLFADWSAKRLENEAYMKSLEASDVQV